MAYKSSVTSSSSFHDLSSISGVPVKIAEEYLPPKKVTLPLKLETSFQNQNPSEVLFMEYNFDLEEQVIKWSEAYRDSQKRLEEAESDISDANGLSLGYATEDPPQEPGSQDDLSPGNSPGETAESSSDVPQVGPPVEQGKIAQDISPQAPNLFTLGTGILVPTQVPYKAAETSGGVNGNKKDSFDLADFEREQDPFDNAELRVMNDLEELNKVLQKAQCTAASDSRGAVSSQSVAVTVQATTAQTATVSAQNANLLNGVTRVQTAMQDNLNLRGPHVAPVHSSQPKSVKDIEYPELDSLESMKSDYSITNSVYTGGSHGLTNQSTALPYKPPNAYPQKGDIAPHVSSYQPQVTSFNVSANPNNPFSGMVHTSNPFVPNTPYSMKQSTNPFVNHAVTYNKRTDAAHLVKPSDDMQIQQQAHIPTSSVQSFGFLSHGSGVPHSAGSDTSQRLRSCRSTPDISSLADNTPMHLKTSRTPPPNIQAQRQYLREQTKSPGPERRPSQPLFSDTNPWGSYPSKTTTLTTTTTAPVAMVTSHRYNGHPVAATVALPKKTSSLPDPYTELSDEARSLVNNITAMGFPRACVARAVQKLGADDKQVVDFLCLVTKLTENGHSVDDAEVALQLYENKHEKADKHLKLASRLRELGFNKDKIQAALVESQLDENKAIDILTGNS